MHDDSRIANETDVVIALPGQPRLHLGALIQVDGELHRILAQLHDRILLVSVAAHRIYLEQDLNGAIGLPSLAHLAGMVTAGRVKTVTPDIQSDLPRTRLVAEIDMLDRAGVPNGSKAIAIHLHRNWTADLRERFGEHDNPAMLKRWRTAARRAGRPS